MTEFPIGTLILPEPARTAAWQRWRKGVDVDALSWECQQTLPAVAAWLPQWLAGDKAGACMQGIVKMAWSRNQVRLYRAAQLRQLLLAADVATVAIAGPLAWSLLARDEGSIRTIPDIALLIPRGDVFRAVRALQAQGWELQNPQPDTDTLTWSSNLALTSGDETLHLHWRLVAASGLRDIEFETAMMEPLVTVRWKGHEFQVLSPEADLLHRLMDRPAWDPVRWDVDVLMMRLENVDWVRFRALTARFATYFAPVDAVARLMAMRSEWQLPVPAIAPVARPSRRFGSAGFAGIRRLGSLLWRS